MKKLLYFFPVHTSFIAADYEILSTKYEVSSFYFKPYPKWHTPYYFFSQLLFIVFRLHQTAILFSQFSGYHSFLPALFSRLFNIPHFIVLNGTECNNFPEIKYGYIARPLLFWFSKKSLQWSTKLFPVSQSLVSAEYTYMDTKYIHQGYTNFYKKVNTPYTVIHNGVSIQQFNLAPSIQRGENSFVTVAVGLERQNRREVKGLDLMIELARLTPDYHYTLIGGQKPAGLEMPVNITIIDFVPHQELSAIYNRHKFYLQLSVTEGFGISVCEAMLSGCVPIVSQVGILPCLAGVKGYVLPFKNVDLLLALVKRAVSEYLPENSMIYRQHIFDLFPLSMREQELLQAIESA